MPDPVAQPPRLNSLDQFRGYTVLGMFVVNFVGSFAVIKQFYPLLAHHNTYCSYADTIMPQFFLAVGFGYRMTFVRRAARDGAAAAYGRVVRRALGLLLLALVVYQSVELYQSWDALRAQGWRAVLTTAFGRIYFQTLTHIAVTTLWIMPVIAARPVWRIGYAVGSAALFHGLSEWWYYEWAARRAIDGGPLGFLTWTIPMTVGTLAYDAMAPYLRARESDMEPARKPRPPAGRLLVAAVALMLAGYALSCLNRVTPPNSLSDGKAAGVSGLLAEPPFVPPARKETVNIWTMSQRAGSVSYLTFSAGFALAVYALFVVACDRGSLQLGVFRTLGVNALTGYVLHELVNMAVRPYVPKDAPLWHVLAGLAVSVGACYLVLRFLEKRRLFLRL